MQLFTIGFTQKTAEVFFNLLKDNGVDYLLDVRLNTDSQLSRFAHGKDLPYLLKEIAGIKYKHVTELAPTAELLKAYRDKIITWEEYKTEYLDILRGREVLLPGEAERPCLLCSEAEAERCHRRLAAEYLRDHYGGLEVKHL